MDTRRKLWRRLEGFSGWFKRLTPEQQETVVDLAHGELLDVLDREFVRVVALGSSTEIDIYLGGFDGQSSKRQLREQVEGGPVAGERGSDEPAGQPSDASDSEAGN